MRGAANSQNDPLYEYTLMPTHMRGMFPVDELRETTLSGPFTFTKGCPLMRIPAQQQRMRQPHVFQTMLFDLRSDPLQQQPISDPAVEARMIEHLLRLMQANDAPKEQYERVGLSIPVTG